MPEEIKTNEAPAASNPTEVSKNASGPVITQEQRTTEVLDSNGKSLSESSSTLGSIFDKIETGQSAAEAIKDTMGNKETTPVKDEGIVIEKQKTPAASEKKAEELKTDAKDDEVSDDELRPLPHDKPKTFKRIEKLLKKLGDAENRQVTTQKEADDRAKKVADLEAEIGKIRSANPLDNEVVKKNLDELAMYKRRYNLENDPEVKKRFDDRVSGAEAGIHKLLSDVGTPESIIDIVKSEGGWIKFADSQRVIPLTTGKSMTAAEVAEAVRSAIPLSERRKLESMELEQTQASRDKETYFSEEQKKASDWLAQQEAQAKGQTEAQRKQFEEATKYVRNWREKFIANNDWLKEKQIPASASAEEKAAIEDHNKYAKQTNGLMDKYLAAKDLDGMLEALTDAVKYHQERRNVAGLMADKQKLEAQLKAKQDELDRFKRTSSAIPRNGSLTSPSVRSPEGESKAPPSLEDAFARIAEGKSLDS